MKRWRIVCAAGVRASPAAEERLGLAHRHREHLADVAATEAVLQHRRLVPLPLAVLAGGGDRVHEPELGIDDAGAVAGRTGALGIGAEQGGLHAVGLRERRADRVEQPGVGRGVAASRALDPALVDRHDAVPARDRAVDQRALARPGHAGEHHQHAERDVDIDVLEVVGAGAAHLEPARWRPHRRLHRRAVVQVSPGQRGAGPQRLRAFPRRPPRRPRTRRRGPGRRRGRRWR